MVLADPIPTPRLPLRSLPRTRRLPPLAPDSPSRPGGGAECRGATWVWAPSPLPLSRTRQARILVHICQSGCWGFPERLVLWEEKPMLPVLWPGETLDRCWTGRESRTTSCCLAVAIPSRVRGSGGGARRSQFCPQVPQCLEVEFSPGWARANPRDSQWCPRGPRVPTLCSVPSLHRLVAFIAAQTWGRLSPQRRKGLFGRCRCDPLLCATAFREVEGLCGMGNEAGQRLLPAVHPLSSGYPRRDGSVHKTRIPRELGLCHI